MGRRGKAPAGRRGPDGTVPDGASRTPPGRAERRRLARRVKRRRRRSALTEIPLLATVAVLIALVLKTFLVQAFVIPSGSMEQTIRIDDRVLVDKLTPWFGAKPRRGDVVVFEDPGNWLQQEAEPPSDDPVVLKQLKQALTFIGLLPSADERDLIKRVVAVGGDTVKCCGADGRITVNGVALDEPYLHPGNAPSTIPFEVKVPQGRVFVMGDHRSDSADSRFHLDEPEHGTVSEDRILGRAVVIAWPIGHWRGLEERATFASVPEPRASGGGTETAASGGGVDAAARDGGAGAAASGGGVDAAARGAEAGAAASPGKADAVARDGGAGAAASRDVADTAAPRGGPDTAGTQGVSHSLAQHDLNGLPRLPTPAELLLVMGVVGLSLFRGGRLHGLRSGCGGCGRRRTTRTRRAREAAGADRPVGGGHDG
ncbi:signal peptidase I [Streptomyces roseicoloratus]|uniref:Signal peptidase I n=1 Tax=Streptomyces roseicoloratus TaxID=2508722 RepID=A0ABY9RRP0_9ACTN|nr:signal peptidase I [Streptomyces roseicoloratus]WMX44841.1 signal peptidase I [Streptomyces roseicoloratus]